MNDEPDREEAEADSTTGGRSFAIAMIVGIIVFAVTDNAAWIAIGIAIGAALAARERASS